MNLRAIKNKVKEKINKKWNLEELKASEKRKQYKYEIKNQIQMTKNSNNIESEQKNFKGIILQTTDKMIGRKREEKKKGWFDNECEDLIRKKKEARLKWITTGNEDSYQIYKRIRGEATKVMKKKKEKWIKQIMET